MDNSVLKGLHCLHMLLLPQEWDALVGEVD